MRRISLVVCLWGLSVLLLAPPAQAVGLGFYGSLGGGNADWEAEDDSGNDADWDSDTRHTGFGFVLDTAVARDRVFNYRLNIGYDRYTDDGEDGGSRWKVDFDGVTIDNTFGFGVVRTPVVRFWLGPQIRVAGYVGSPDNVDDLDITLVGVGVGPVLGLNLNFGPVVTLAVDLGVRWMVYGGNGDWDDGSGRDDIDFTVSEPMVYLNGSLLFRIGDTF